MPLVYLRRARRTHDTLTWVFNDDPDGLNGIALVEEDGQAALASGTFEFPDYQADSIILVEQNSQDALASGTFEFPDYHSDSIILVEQNSQDALASGTFEFPDYHDDVLQFGPESPPPVVEPEEPMFEVGTLTNWIAPFNWDPDKSGVYNSTMLSSINNISSLETYATTDRVSSLSSRYQVGSGYNLLSNEDTYTHRFVFVPAEPLVIDEIRTLSDQYDTSGGLQLTVIYTDGTRSSHYNDVYGPPSADLTIDEGADYLRHNNTLYPENKIVAFFYFEGAMGYPQGSPRGILEMQGIAGTEAQSDNPGDNIVNVDLTAATYTADPSVRGFEFYDSTSPVYALTDTYAVARVTDSSAAIYTGPNYSNTHTINESYNYFTGVRDKFYGVTQTGQFKVWTYDAGWTSTNGPTLTAITTTEEGETWISANIVAMTVNRVYATDPDPNTYLYTIKILSATTGELLAEIDSSDVPAGEKNSFGYNVSVSPDESLIAIDAYPNTYVYEKTASGYAYLGNVNGTSPSMTSTSLLTVTDTGILEHTWNGSTFSTVPVATGAFDKIVSIPSGNAFMTFRSAQRDYALYARSAAGAAWGISNTFVAPGASDTYWANPSFITNDGARIVLTFDGEGNNFTVYKKN